MSDPENGQCPLFGLSRKKFISNYHGSFLSSKDLLQCQSCELIYSDKLPSKSELNEYYEFVEFKDIDARKYEYENSSLITSIFTLQFMPKSDREELITKIYNGLKRGGAYIFAEKTICESALVQDMITFNYYNYKRKSFTTEDIMDKERTLRHMMKPNTWKEIEKMVLDAGFNVVQPFWRNHAFVGALAVK